MGKHESNVITYTTKQAEDLAALREKLVAGDPKMGTGKHRDNSDWQYRD